MVRGFFFNRRTVPDKSHFGGDCWTLPFSMAALTLASTWTPQSCPGSTEIWEIFTYTNQVFFLLGPITATSECAPPGYTPNVPYNAVSCPDSYTPACTKLQGQLVTTVCCPTWVVPKYFRFDTLTRGQCAPPDLQYRHAEDI